MNKVALKSVMTGMFCLLTLEQAWISNNRIIGVVFKDNFSYRLSFVGVIHMHQPFILADTCYNFSEQYCYSPRYWYKGFLSLQSSIDAAIIEGVANHSVWEEMKSIAGIRMKSQGVISSISLEYSYFMITVVMCFSAFMHFLSMNIVKEKKKLKALMKMMGLQDIAFWLSWSLLYALYVLVLSFLQQCDSVSHASGWGWWHWKCTLPMNNSHFLQVHFAFLLSSLLRSSKLVESIVFLFIFVFGCLSLAVLVENIPEPMQWFLSLFCPYAFNAGIAKIFHLEKFGIGLYFSNLMEESYFLFSTYIVLIFDSVLYLLLAIYFDKVLSGKYDVYLQLYSFTCILLIYIDCFFFFLFFLSSPKPYIFLGLFLNIYEGQITALLGHSGAGKTTLLNVLSGLTLPSEGSATIYNSNLSEMGDREEIREMIGICPQFNVQFEVLTVKENLQTFAEIKGIKSKDVEQEVKNILELLDITNIQDTQAEKLSGGQKRKLSIAIAMLGDPQVLLLDEPTAGLDPLSRYQVWSLLKEHRSGRVILFSTQFMDEADILADRKAFISHGRLKCIGSSLFLKKKWGIGYHLSIHVSESCDLENVTALVKRHIPNAVFSGHRQYELKYKLPLENVNKFPDLFSHLDSCSEQGIINYGVNVTTLEDVFLKLEEETLEQGALLLDIVEATASGMALWRQQVYAMARVHLFKLKSSLKNLGSILLLYSVFLLPVVLQMALVAAWQSVSAWELSPARYFLPLGSKAHSDTTTLLVLNKTASFSIRKMTMQILSYRGQNPFATQTLGFILFSCPFKSYRFTVLCHMKAINCFPVLVNIISNALLGTFNSTEHIRIWSHPFFNVSARVCEPGCVTQLFLKPLEASIIQDYKTGARAQLRVSGLLPSAYWCGQALVDIPLSWFLLFSMLGLQFAMSNKVSGSVMAIFGYGMSMVLFVYLMSFLFRKGWNCDFWSFILIVVSIQLDNVLQGFRAEGKSINVATSFFQPYIHSVGFIFLLRYLEIKYGRAVLRKDPIFRIFPRKENRHQNAEELEEEDEDVKAERTAVRNAIASPSQDEKCSVLISGEVLGLLGPNGAGKSTAIKMIIGETTRTAGQVGASSHLQDHTPDFLGCCPQEDPLWPNLTVQDHLEAYAAVKGVRKEDMAAAINRYGEVVPAISEHFVSPSQGNGEGTRTSKLTLGLCFAVSMLGNPTVLLLDEVSTGMDPNGQKMIRAAVKNKEQGAILTTHYMEEAEAVCDRVAIMVSGQLRCIGSIQYLKSKFGKGYILEIKVKDPERTDLLHAEVLRIFPSAVFLELSREQEKENFDLTLDGTFDWKQLQQEDN
uniref:ABC transporter domain-containing protein n=1 Tax=Nothoprocta perdicaria TaxID=30464 RepID=A0A8C6Z540_NOTPE